jgi:hypothetical protein
MTLCPFAVKQYLRLGKVTHRRKETQGNNNRRFGKTETDGEMCHMKWKCIGGVGVREADRMKAMFRTGK